MIKFENEMLVLGSTATKEDVDAINEYARYIRKDERERLIRILSKRLDKDTAEEVVFLINDINIL